MATNAEMLSRAVQYHQAGDAAQAESLYRQVLQTEPDHADALHLLGVLAYQAGQHAAALGYLRRALTRNPAAANYHANLGLVYTALGQQAVAIDCYRQALRLQPDYANAHNALGAALMAQGKIDEAIACYRQALHFRPDYVDAHINLGVALNAHGQLAEAVASYRAALRLRPDCAEALVNLGDVLGQQGQLEEALASCREAVRLRPAFPQAHLNLGNALKELGRLAEAEAAWKEALRLKPDYADAHFNLGGAALAEKGDLETAAAYFRATLRCDPEYVEAYGMLATHMRGQLTAEDEAAMRRFLQREPLGDIKRALLNYGLAHSCDRRGEANAAAEHARLANAHRLADWSRQGMAYRSPEHDLFIASMMQVFTPTFFERVRGWGLDTELPVFLFGLPRSGTTLLEQVLASHPQVHGAGELSLVQKTVDSLPALVGSTALPLACLGRLTPQVAEQAGRAHLQLLRQLNGEALRIVEKMPDNYLWLGLLATLFPRARFIYSRRDVRDVAVSCWLTGFQKLAWTCTMQDIASRIRAHELLMAHWRKVLPVPMLEVDYEETVADVERSARRMLDCCGLDWHPACLAFHETKRTVRTASVSQVRQPIYRTSVQRWKLYESALGPLFAALAEEPPLTSS